MANIEDIEMQIEDLDIDNEKNEELILEGNVEEDVNRFEFCLVGKFLTKKKHKCSSHEIKNC